MRVFATWRIRQTGRVQKFLGSFSSSELSSHQISVGAPGGQKVQDFPASRSPFEVISVCSLFTRTHCLKGRVPLQLMGCPMEYILKLSRPRHRRRRGSVPAPAGNSATTARRLYGAVATAYPLPGCPYFVGYFLMVRLLFEGDGISPPRPPGSASRLPSLRAGQGQVRYVVLYMLRGLLVDSSRR